MAKPFSVPRGFALVPIQPTEAMLDAIAGTPWSSLSPSKQAAEFAAWRQLLKAAERAVDAAGVDVPLAPDLLRRCLDTFNALLGDMEGIGSRTSIDDDLLPDVKARVAELERAARVKGRALPPMPWASDPVPDDSIPLAQARAAGVAIPLEGGDG